MIFSTASYLDFPSLKASKFITYQHFQVKGVNRKQKKQRLYPNYFLLFSLILCVFLIIDMLIFRRYKYTVSLFLKRTEVVQFALYRFCCIVIINRFILKDFLRLFIGNF